MREFGKKAQIGSTLTWIVAFILVVFIMAIFVVGAVGIAKAKGIASSVKNIATLGFLKSGEIQQTNSEFDDSLILILNTKTSSGTLLDEIKGALDFYLKDASVMNLLGGDINSLSAYKDTLNSELRAQTKEKDEKTRELAISILDGYCSAYIFTSPGFVIDKSNTNSKEYLEVKFTKEISLRAPYKNQILEIKYRKLKEC